MTERTKEIILNIAAKFEIPNLASCSISFQRNLYSTDQQSFLIVFVYSLTMTTNRESKQKTDAKSKDIK